jgi:hypothetical protein
MVTFGSHFGLELYRGGNAPSTTAVPALPEMTKKYVDA